MARRWRRTAVDARQRPAPADRRLHRDARPDARDRHRRADAVRRGPPFRLDDGIRPSDSGIGLGGLLRASGLTWRTRAVLVAVLSRIRADRQRAVARAEGRTVSGLVRRAAGRRRNCSTGSGAAGRQRDEHAAVTDACAAIFVNVLADSLVRAAGGDRFPAPACDPVGRVRRSGARLAARGRRLRCLRFDVRRIIRADGGYRRALQATGRVTRPATSRRRGRWHRARRPRPHVPGSRPIGRRRRDRAAADSAAISNESALLPLIAALVPSAPPDHDLLSRLADGPADPVRDPGRPAGSDPAPRSTRRRPPRPVVDPSPDAARLADRCGVISDSRWPRRLPREQLAASVGRQLTGQLRLPPAPAFAVFHERRATFDCVPDRPADRDHDRRVSRESSSPATITTSAIRQRSKRRCAAAATPRPSLDRVSPARWRRIRLCPFSMASSASIDPLDGDHLEPLDRLLRRVGARGSAPS